VGGSIHIDISSVQNTSYGGAKFRLLIQDGFTSYLWSYFIKAKSDLSDTIIYWLKLVQKEIKLNVKSIRLETLVRTNIFIK
jgi:hypothetical protein